MSNANYQFPPSSPLHDAEEVLLHHNKDPFALTNGKKPQSLEDNSRQSRTVEYPTPNPSSSLFRSSSPAREEAGVEGGKFTTSRQNKDINNINKKRTVAINKNFNILKSDTSILRIPFLSNHGEFAIGRSSQTCQYNLNAKDSFISRAHVRINYTPQQMVINCVGANGMGIVIPKTCFVYAKPSNKNDYIVIENTTGEPLSTNKSLSDSIKLATDYSQFYIHKGESVTLPRRFENVLLEISKSVVLLNPMDVDEPLTDNDEELTDDEELVLIKNIGNSHIHKTGTDHDLTPLNKILSSSVPQTPSKPKTDSITMMQSSPKQGEEEMNMNRGEQVARDEEDEDDYYQTPSKHHSIKLRQPQPGKTVQFDIYSNKVDGEPSPHKRSLSNPSNMVLTDVTNTDNSGNSFRRASSAEPHTEKTTTNTNRHKLDKHVTNERKGFSSDAHQQEPMIKKRKKQITRQQTPELDNSALSLPNLSEIENILVNHLAFSRLSSTPASFLNTISAATSKLSLLQVRSILHNLKCIGIIYRQGTDAAGKPLEEEYYYMPEQDDDEGRQNLVSNVKGHGGLRSCRRTHKQYYWKKPAPIKK
ncbi:TOS4 [Candida margitis]|uniref:TOS4 n=1 Tax=Candida margitis TaxID=1775924 RepID=UPI002227668B|nr:TOS4 [Candida margitis]KAI5969973.1 TOS4 [Candida margitis]